MNSRYTPFYPFYSKNETDSSFVLFESRKFYEEQTLEYISNNGFLEQNFQDEERKKIPFGDLHGENYLYCVVDEEGDIIAPIENNFIVAGKNEKGDDIKMLNITFEAYKNMKNFLSSLEVENKIPKDSFFYNIKIKTGIIGIDDFYKNLAIVVAEKFKNLALNNRALDSKIVDEKSFIHNYIPFLIKHMQISPVTKTSCVLFLNSKYFSNGVTFSFSLKKTGNDEFNFEKIFLDKSFLTFSQACLRYGFMIDKKNPQFLFIDLKSPALSDFFKKHSIKKPADFFNKNYKKVYSEDIEELKLFFYISYLTFLKNNNLYQIDVRNSCISDIKKQEYRERKILKYDSFIKKFKQEFWVSLYIYLKNFEVGYNLSQEDYEILLKRCKLYVSMNKEEVLLRYLNDIFNTFLINNQFRSLQENKQAVQRKNVFESLSEEDIEEFSKPLNTSLIFRG